MTEHPDQWELDVIPPLRSITIILDVSPPELELAVATSGASLCPAMDESHPSPPWSSMRHPATRSPKPSPRRYRRESLRLLALTWLR
jgi:hypothetical protein